MRPMHRRPRCRRPHRCGRPTLPRVNGPPHRGHAQLTAPAVIAVDRAGQLSGRLDSGLLLWRLLLNRLLLNRRLLNRLLLNRLLRWLLVVAVIVLQQSVTRPRLQTGRGTETSPVHRKLMKDEAFSPILDCSTLPCSSCV